MKRTLSALLMFFWVAACLAADPKAVIVGPSSSQPGDLVVLRTDGSVGRDFRWSVVPKEATTQFFAFNQYAPEVDADGKTVMRLSGSVGIFASRKPGTYTFILAVGQGDKVDVVSQVLQNGEVAPPNPNPPLPPNPDPKAGWAAWAKATAERLVPPEGRRSASLSLGSAMESVCAAVDSGTLKTPREAREEIRRADHRALGERAQAWKAFSDALDGEMQKILAGGKLTELSQYREIWAGVASGLKGVQ